VEPRIGFAGNEQAASMKRFRNVIICGLLLPVCATAQQEWDDLDVLDGPNPTLRYGSPFGRTAVKLPVRSYDRTDGLLELGWEEKPGRKCRLQRHTELLFMGNCMEKLAVMPMAIRVANESDSEWMGIYMPVSETDIAILARAKQILAGQEQRNQSGDRNCDDDIAAGKFSMFCALYSASIEIAGVYRHRRPAMQALRKVLHERYPGQYAHRLRDINNKANISDGDLLEAFDLSRARLLSELQSIRY
jgi:hypothetical protein